jgi:hypothetical protein
LFQIAVPTPKGGQNDVVLFVLIGGVVADCESPSLLYSPLLDFVKKTLDKDDSFGFFGFKRVCERFETVDSC